ncbi:winged helix-turn-helix domain-containing protein [Streptomyces sp. NPDC057249]|uniref:winged helix-turn-helix domain-containing protein n=1 Tax=Streptomyces sp. NPDC057249 TaxID=3346067 RepID=UPI00362ECC14
MMPYALARRQSIPATRRQFNRDRFGETSQTHRRRIAPHVAASITKGLSAASARLLLEGDVEGRYPGRNDAEEGYRLTMALAAGASQPGREWMPADFYRALLYSPTPGGEWARRLMRGKGPEFAERKLAWMLAKARTWVQQEAPITCRHSAWEAIERVRTAVERHPWPSRKGGASDLKNMSVRLGLCERGGGLDHELSARRQAELMGCAVRTAVLSNRRLRKAGWLVLEKSGAGSETGSKWRLCSPGPDEAVGAGVTHPPATGEAGGAGPRVSLAHTDTRNLARLVSLDAFHHYGHGANGARLLTLLEEEEGKSRAELQTATGLDRTTVSRRLSALVADGLVAEVEGLFYLVSALAGPAGVMPDQQVLQETAKVRGTAGAGARRRARHVRERLNYRRWRAERRSRHVDVVLRLVPAGVVDVVTGEIIDPAWEGWDVSDPYRPVPRPRWAAAA